LRSRGARARARIYGDTVNTVGESLDEIRAKGRIRIAVYADFPPFSFARDGTVLGIDVDIARLVADRLGVQLDLAAVQASETVDDDLRNHVWRGSVVDRTVANLMLHIPYSRELQIRSELAVLLPPYYEETLIVACDPEQLDEAPSLEALKGKRIGVELDSLPDFYLSWTLGGQLREDVRRFRRPEEGLDALLAGEVAAFMGMRSQVEARLGAERERFDLPAMELPGLTMPSWPIGAAVRENARDLGWAAGDILDAAVRDRTIEGIFRAHGITYRPPSLT
jgi:ABC-type amino acid transport substrate-binding protein